MRGDEILNAEVEINETGRLYRLTEADGHIAEPDWNAPAFRQRTWPEASRAH